jgi:hypothetical protein
MADAIVRGVIFGLGFVSAPVVAQQTVVTIKGEPGSPHPSEISVHARGNPVEFSCGTSGCSRSLPSGRNVKLLISYASGQAPLNLTLIARTSGAPISIKLPRPAADKSCDIDDEERLDYVPDNSREALRQIVQISHLLHNEVEPCPRIVVTRLQQIRLRSVHYLRSETAYFQSMYGDSRVERDWLYR